MKLRKRLSKRNGVCFPADAMSKLVFYASPTVLTTQGVRLGAFTQQPAASRGLFVRRRGQWVLPIRRGRERTLTAFSGNMFRSLDAAHMRTSKLPVKEDLELYGEHL